MRKKSVLFVLVLLIAAMFISCSTVNIRHDDTYSEDEASYALKAALDTASEQASQKLTDNLSSMDFIVQRYAVLKEEMKNIPGMSTLISNFNASMTDYLKENLTSYFDYTKSLLSSTEFVNPIQMVISSDSSASNEFLQNNGAKLKTKLNEILGNANYSGLSSCIRHFNAYAATNRSIENTVQPLEMTNISTEIADMLFDRFSVLMKSSEELYRTTPDPYADQIAAIVFGIN